MITIKDRQRLLNLNYMAIYLMLTSDEIAQYGDKLKNLNRHTTLTRGLFHFDVVERGDNPYDELPKEITHATEGFNVMVRLINDIHEMYGYGLEKIDLGLEMSVLVKELNKFVDAVCEENIDRLDVLGNRNTGTSMAAMKKYRESNIVKEVFTRALKGKIENREESQELVQTAYPTPDMATSLDLAKGATDDKYALSIERDRCEREEPSEKPDISIKVTYVKTGKVRKDGSRLKKLGMEFTINGDTVPVYLGSNDQKFLYFATLLAKMEGETLKRSDFSPLAPNDTVGKKRRERMEKWLHDRFCALIVTRNFNKWYKGVKEDPHPVDHAKSRIKAALWKILSPKYKNAFYYTLILNENGRYKIRVSASHIEIDPKIMERINKFQNT